VLFGDVNPSAKLPMTFPRTMGQIPISYQQYETGRPVRDVNNIVYKSAYIDAPNTPRYAFGHGLSYTRFAYRDLSLSQSGMTPDGTITLSFMLANLGKRAGAEVVQLYLRDPVASRVRPVKELKGFQRVVLQPGEERLVRFTVDRQMLSFFDRTLAWTAEPGKFELMVGSASDDIRLRGTIELLAP
jgi:beta-glucosidase